jgi:ATP-binding cassette, subfamily B, bacterial HlyB/CyaB
VVKLDMWFLKTSPPRTQTTAFLTVRSFEWLIGSLCSLHHVPFSGDLLRQVFPSLDGQYVSEITFQLALKSIGFRVKAINLSKRNLKGLPLPFLAQLKSPIKENSPEGLPTKAKSVGLVVSCNNDQVVFFEPNQAQPRTQALAEFEQKFNGLGWLFSLDDAQTTDDGAAIAQSNQGRTQAKGTTFSFSWFVPELLRYKKIWRDVLLASFVLQLVMLTTPLLTQVIIDKVVVHRTQSTLISVGTALLLCILFNALLSWGRQHLIIHTGNRIDAVLGSTVWEYLLKLPITYFDRRPAGTVAARLHAVESIREFVSGAAISLILDIPFLIICVGVMFWYNSFLTISVSIFILVIALISIVIAPIFQKQLNEQFLLSARNQAFITEHISGFETVKTLQMEPQLRDKYSLYLASFLLSSFKTKQTSNTYNSLATAIEQMMNLFILVVGAYLVMASNPTLSFTIGMLVAFQMFAGKLSQPLMRIVGLWTQFQQAKLAVDRLGDILNSPIEPYSITPIRAVPRVGHLVISQLGFRYSQELPLLYSNFNLEIVPGSSIAIMGPSGSGKSTLSKLLLGFYQPTNGSIKLDGIDTRNLSANELRSYFGVVPQETILFSGTILDNLRAGHLMASFEDITLAAKLAGIHNFIDQLPLGYETEIGERGIGLSGGQKQRLAIARALLKKPKILIFDEATSALDSVTAEDFAKTVNSLKGSVTVLFITHRIPKNLFVDRTLKINDNE